MTRRALGLAVGLAVLAPATASAQTYSFEVPSMRMENHIQPDASVRIVYDITFQNSSWGDPIDVVDVGLPHEDYDISNMTASVDGTEVHAIQPSEYIDIGVEVHLGLAAIPSGQRGVFHFEATMPDMVYSDTTNDELASFEITPTWFDANVVQGTTDLQVMVFIPGVHPDQVVHHGEGFDAKALTDEGAIVGWHDEFAQLTGPYENGLSFPRSVMERVVEVTILDLFMKWWADSPGARIITGLIVLVLFAVAFFRYTGGTGWSLFVLLLAGGGCLFWFQPVGELIVLPILVFVGILMELRRGRRRRKYLPPIASMEGGGIKRGLTAPEAAVLLERPLGQVLTLVIFGLLKKGLVRQVKADPLQVEVVEAFAVKSKKGRRKAAGTLKTVIHDYEHAFLDAIVDSKGLTVRQIDFADAMKRLIERVADRVESFDVDETRDYYRSLVERAWTDAQSIGEVEQRTRAVDGSLPWLLLAPDYDTRFNRWERGGYTYVPMWFRSGPQVTSVSAAVSGGHHGGTTSFSDVAASFAGWTENVTGSLAGRLTGVSVGGKSGGFVDLSGMDTVTGDVLGSIFSGSGGGGGGGGGGGCACACAGCACACACAGGGR